ncbi:hypothetical protein ACEWY4_004030 [Coilia grayii]|uniref:Gastrin-releasing peptide n=1 Tax=Coilia grayii TaxID=363190 RepID=A0ABD1KKY1_9TELE
MCLPWRCRQLIAISVIFTSVACEGQLNDAGKVYPRGNHWAVGHLMGKKSTDNLLEFGERDGDMGQFVASTAEVRGLDPTLGPSASLWGLIRTLLTSEHNEEHVSRKQVQNILEEKRREEEEREQHRHLKEVGEE